ncbi:MAG: carboxypeptidase regulatory-like domain-containing protein [Ignavibacteriaceae bacterium]|jgi:hypothetical protein|nr:MAG: T9SS C-terminal target domain-containing protein [Chlorobiota bacterium]KXK02622.1 MAG: 5'-nucleotidase [Chlorobi bacterium OLB4]MBV6398757.1 hypothetical protein [Ignavibacteria bacterium]MCC6885071.1 carboxypeptidase regulatory-like domain-containing protein [Ignavibacteriales bacterium]MCE7952138.1 T9SS C-terminal target domain-containing protein [Chlorobi bacterium CHB7]MDL1886305.1 T9SS type A sorting domain-containing protein [Ignavibacteria bacterium CHB1]MEB2329424.1 carboxype
MKRFISNSAGNRSGFILSLITVVVVSLFFISGISQAHIIQGYALAVQNNENAVNGMVYAYKYHQNQTLIEIGSSSVAADGFYSITIPNNTPDPVYLEMILPRIGEELECGSWYPNALTFEDAEAIYFPQSSPETTEEQNVFFYLIEEPDLAGSTAKISGKIRNVSMNSIAGIHVIIRNSAGIFGSIITDPEGNYEIDNIPFGRYEIITSKPNYKSNIEVIDVFAEKVTHNITVHHMVDNTSHTSNGITPQFYSLSQNYPNPFNPVTNISFSLPEISQITLIVSDMTGREVATLLNGRFEAGSYNTTFNATELSSGVYIYRINVTGISGTKFSDTKRMVLLK